MEISKPEKINKRISTVESREFRRNLTNEEIRELERKHIKT